jgi:Protein of unknown function (DUF1257)
MSHFASMQTQLVNQSALLTGLQALLAEHQIPAIVEVHDPATILENAYDASSPPQFAHLIIRRSQLDLYSRRALLDVGFKRTQSGPFELIADDWDIRQNAIGQAIGNSTQFLCAVQVQYNIAIVRQTISPHLWDHSEIQTLDDGTKRLVLTQRPLEVVTL